MVKLKKARQLSRFLLVYFYFLPRMKYMNYDFGNINSHTVSLAMKEAVRRAIKEIRRQRFAFEAYGKISIYKDNQDDLVTSADFAAQDIYKEVLMESFPLAGIVAEENFSCECSAEDQEYYFTIDPLDGTKAFGRRQSHGVGSMVSFVINKIAEGSCVGDVMTEEIYLTRPGSLNAYKISDYEIAERMEINQKKNLKDQYVLLRTDPRKYSSLVQKMTDPNSKDALFKESENTGGSIGIMFARLWKGEVGAVIIRPGMQTPWDMCPLIPISRKLGFKYFLIKENTIEPYELLASKENIEIHHELLVIHESREIEAFEWMKSNAQ